MKRLKKFRKICFKKNRYQLYIPTHLDGITQAVTHEIVDSLTDSPGNQTGYVMNECHHLDPKTFTANCEIAQYCGHYMKRVNGVLVEV